MSNQEDFFKALGLPQVPAEIEKPAESAPAGSTSTYTRYAKKYSDEEIQDMPWNK